MSATLFFDPVCGRPYDTETLRREAMGGTEATVVRVADALGALVVQHNRTEASGRYLPPRSDPAVGHVIVNRDSRALATARQLYPNARIHLWLHDRVRPRSKRARRASEMKQKFDMMPAYSGRQFALPRAVRSSLAAKAEEEMSEFEQDYPW